MSAFGTKLRKGEGEYYMFWCPGCNEAHAVGAGPNQWTFNHDPVKPTFNPSVLLKSGHFAEHYEEGDNCWCKYYAEHPNKKPAFKCFVCHSFVRDGQIQFLSDCTHALAGQTVDLPDWPQPVENSHG
jgi:hypothetical protein